MIHRHQIKTRMWWIDSSTLSDENSLNYDSSSLLTRDKSLGKDWNGNEIFRMTKFVKGCETNLCTFYVRDSYCSKGRHMKPVDKMLSKSYLLETRLPADHWRMMRPRKPPVGLTNKRWPPSPASRLGWTFCSSRGVRFCDAFPLLSSQWLVVKSQRAFKQGHKIALLLV